MEVLGTLIRATINNTNKIDILTNDLNKYAKTVILYSILSIGGIYLIKKHIQSQDARILKLEKKVEQIKN